MKVLVMINAWLVLPVIPTEIVLRSAVSVERKWQRGLSDSIRTAPFLLLTMQFGAYCIKGDGALGCVVIDSFI